MVDAEEGLILTYLFYGIYKGNPSSQLRTKEIAAFIGTSVEAVKYQGVTLHSANDPSTGVSIIEKFILAVRSVWPCCPSRRPTFKSQTRKISTKQTEFSSGFECRCCVGTNGDSCIYNCRRRLLASPVYLVGLGEVRLSGTTGPSDMQNSPETSNFSRNYIEENCLVN